LSGTVPLVDVALLLLFVAKEHWRSWVDCKLMISL
jgi:hypothetical protein